MRGPKRAESKAESDTVSRPNIIPLRRTTAPTVEQQTVLITATDAARQFGVDKRQLWQWVSLGTIRAFTSRFTGWPLYSESEIAAVVAGRSIAGGAPELEMDEAYERVFGEMGPEELPDLITLARAVEARGEGDSAFGRQLRAKIVAYLRQPPGGGEPIFEGGPDSPQSLNRAHAECVAA